MNKRVTLSVDVVLDLLMAANAVIDFAGSSEENAAMVGLGAVELADIECSIEEVERMIAAK